MFRHVIYSNVAFPGIGILGWNLWLEFCAGWLELFFPGWLELFPAWLEAHGSRQEV